jgi:hypothetical protein
MQVSPGTMSPVTTSGPSPRTTAPPCLPLGLKDSLREDARLLLFCFGGFLLWGFCFEAFAFGF